MEATFMTVPRSALDHAPCDGPRHKERPLHGDRDHPVQFLQEHLGRRRPPRRPGIVDEDVHAPIASSAAETRSPRPLASSHRTLWRVCGRRALHSRLAPPPAAPYCRSRRQCWAPRRRGPRSCTAAADLLRARLQPVPHLRPQVFLGSPTGQQAHVSGIQNDKFLVLAAYEVHRSFRLG
jgi:hypothetical protein